MQWFIKIRYKQINLYQVCLVGFVKTNSTRGGVWIHEDISPLDLKSTALTALSLSLFLSLSLILI